jgi:hypothetical protein
MVHETAVLLYAITTGFTCSGIVANLYRVLSRGDKDRFGRGVYLASMVIAGPNELLERAAKAWREKSCSWIAFWLAAAVAAYWGLAIGLFALEVALAF